MKTTAATYYAYQQGVCLHLLGRVKVALDKHQAAAAMKPAHWGYGGDVEQAANKLQEVLAALDVPEPSPRAAGEPARPVTGPLRPELCS